MSEPPGSGALGDGSLQLRGNPHNLPGEDPRARILVAHADHLTKLGLAALLGLQEWVEYCLTARTRLEAVELARSYQPLVALVDVAFEYPLSLEVSRQVLASSPDTRVLLLTASVDRFSPRAAVAARASAYVARAWSGRRIVEAVRQAVVGAELASTEVEHLKELSSRERDVLELIAKGATNGEIAQRLFLSPHTVKEHTSRIYRKLKARNRMEAVQRAQQTGLLQGA